MSSKANSRIKSQQGVSCSALSTLSPRENLRFVTEFYDETTITGRVRHRSYTHVFSEDIPLKTMKELLHADQKDNWRFSLWDDIDDLLNFFDRQNDVVITYDNDGLIRKYYVNEFAEVVVPCGDDDDNLWRSNGGFIVYTDGMRVSWL